MSQIESGDISAPDEATIASLQRALGDPPVELLPRSHSPKSIDELLLEFQHYAGGHEMHVTAEELAILREVLGAELARLLSVEGLRHRLAEIRGQKYSISTRGLEGAEILEPSAFGAIYFDAQREIEVAVQRDFYSVCALLNAADELSGSSRRQQMELARRQLASIEPALRAFIKRAKRVADQSDGHADTVESVRAFIAQVRDIRRRLSAAPKSRRKSRR